MRLAAAVPALLLLIPLALAAKNKTKSAESEEEEIDWQCGTDAFTKYISENQIDIDCPDLKNVINQCCLNHDSCYEDQKGRKFCDDTFCRCLDVVTKPSRLCNKEDGPLFCNLVRDFGASAYTASGNGTKSSKEVDEPLSHALEAESGKNTTTTDYDYETTVKAASKKPAAHPLDHAAHQLDTILKKHN